MSGGPLLAALTLEHLAAKEEQARSAGGDLELDERVERTWDAYYEAATSAGVCLAIPCNAETDRAYCPEHRLRD